MDPYAHTQPTETPDLLTYLEEKGKVAIGGDVVAEAANFLAWAKDFLAANRPVENFPADSNHGVRLSNNDRVLVCPPVPAPGTTAPSGAVEITHGASQSGQEGVSSTDSKRVI